MFVSRRIPDEGLNAIRAAATWTCGPTSSRRPTTNSAGRVEDCDGLVSLLTDRIDGALLDAAPKLKVVSNFAVGFNNVDVAACTARGVCVGNTPGVLTDATADIAVTLLLAAARRVVESAADAKDGQLDDLGAARLARPGPGRPHARHRRHGPHRLRRGQALPPRLGHEGALHRAGAAAEADQELGAERVDLDTLLAESDFVSVHADLNPTTKGMFGAAQFQKMKRTAVFVNTARGPLVDQAALAEALRKRDDLRGRAGRDRPGAACRADHELVPAAELRDRAAHRQRHGRHPQRDGPALRQQPARGGARRSAAELGEPRCGRQKAEVMRSRSQAPPGNEGNYTLRLRRGQSIGSGLVEGAAKNMIGKRLKANNARWCEANVNRMGSICSAMYSEYWDDFWDCH